MFSSCERSLFEAVTVRNLVSLSPHNVKNESISVEFTSIIVAVLSTISISVEFTSIIVAVLSRISVEYS